MNIMRKWMLGAAVVVGGLGLGATTAHAAQIGVYIGGPAAYVPPCPGDGYTWVAGYYAGGYWVPGRWNYVGVRRDFDHDRYVRYGDGDRYRDYDRDRFRDREWDRDRDWDHGHGHAYGHDDHFRGHDRW